MAKREQPAPIGHNSENGVAADELKQFIERIERLEEEKAAAVEDIKEVFSELKGRGFDAPAIRAILKMRKADAEKTREHQAMVELYCHALGIENLFS